MLSSDYWNSKVQEASKRIYIPPIDGGFQRASLVTWCGIFFTRLLCLLLCRFMNINEPNVRLTYFSFKVAHVL